MVPCLTPRSQISEVSERAPSVAGLSAAPSSRSDIWGGEIWAANDPIAAAAAEAQAKAHKGELAAAEARTRAKALLAKVATANNYSCLRSN